MKDSKSELNDKVSTIMTERKQTNINNFFPFITSEKRTGILIKYDEKRLMPNRLTFLPKACAML